jgi:hypothetical protein
MKRVLPTAMPSLYGKLFGPGMTCFCWEGIAEAGFAAGDCAKAATVRIRFSVPIAVAMRRTDRL